MKIGFLVYVPQAKVVYEWKDVQKHSNYILDYSQDHYFLIKALEKNTEFEKEILETREKLDIPKKGYTSKEYENRFDFKLNPADTDNDVIEKVTRVTNFLLDISKESKRIGKKLKLPNYIANQADTLICGNFVAPTTHKIQIIPQHGYTENGKKYFVSININIHSKISKNELVKYLDRYWDFIEKEMDYLKPDKGVYISKRDLRIVDLRDKEKLMFKEIADKVISEFGDDDSAKINEDSVKTAYKRAKDKIFGLTKSQDG